jgi:hypothetical protein
VPELVSPAVAPVLPGCGVTCRADEVSKLHFDIKHLNTLLWNTPAEQCRSSGDDLIASFRGLDRGRQYKHDCITKILNKLSDPASAGIGSPHYRSPPDQGSTPPPPAASTSIFPLN